MSVEVTRGWFTYAEKPAPPGPVLIDSYSETNQDADISLASTNVLYAGQCFTAIAANLGSCKFYMKKGGTPTGNMSAKLYALTGTFGTDAKPTGAALATSDTVVANSLTGAYALTTFTFSGGNQVALTNGTKYGITCVYLLGDASNFVAVGYDNSSGTHAGNEFESTDGSSWSAFAVDVCFYVYST